MLELSDQEFKTTIINMLTAPMDKVDSMKKKKDGQCKQRNGNSKRAAKRHTRDQKHWNRNKESLGKLISSLDKAKERSLELEGISIATSKTEKKREKRSEKTKIKPECPRTVGQLQQVKHE